MLKGIGIALVGLLLYVLFVVATTPAVWLAQQVEIPRKWQWVGIEGTVWSGQIKQLSYDKQRLGDVSWSINPLTLLWAEVSLSWQAADKSWRGSGEIGKSLLSDAFSVQLKANMRAEKLQNLLDFPVDLVGRVQIDIAPFDWDYPQALSAKGMLNWQEAQVVVLDATDLGSVKGVLRDGKLELSNQGGEIEISGGPQLMPDGKYASEIFFTPRANATAATEQLLGQLGKRQRDGRYRMAGQGKLGLF